VFRLPMPAPGASGLTIAGTPPNVTPANAANPSLQPGPPMETPYAPAGAIPPADSPPQVAPLRGALFPRPASLAAPATAR